MIKKGVSGKVLRKRGFPGRPTPRRENQETNFVVQNDASWRGEALNQGLCLILLQKGEGNASVIREDGKSKHF